MTNTTLFPDDFISLLQQTLPEHIDLQATLNSSLKGLRKSIRVNTLKINTGDFIRQQQQCGWHFEAIPWCKDGFWLRRNDETIPLGNTLEHLAGLFYVQEASSMLPVTALYSGLSKLPNVVLDAAAAPGSKTTQIAAQQQGEGVIVANEFSASRVKILASNIQRSGISNVALTNFNANVFGAWAYESFDAILLDAPCSGEGTLRKDPKALQNWSLEHVHQVADLQYRLLESALLALKPGGRLVYSTCTLNAVENQGVLTQVLQRYSEFVSVSSLSELFVGADAALTKEGFLHVWPQLFDCEGFFVAALQRNEQHMPQPEVIKKPRKFPFHIANKKQQLALHSHFKQQFNITLPEQSQLYIRDKVYWLFPIAIDPLLAEIRFSRIGLKLAEEIKNGFRTSHDAIIALGHKADKSVIDIDKEQARMFYQGRDIPFEHQSKGEVILRNEQQVLGLGKLIRGKIKNSLPRELVRDNNLF